MARNIRRTAIVTYSCEQMFDLVNDIESYPQFLPYCVGAKIQSSQSDLVEAELTLSKGGFEHSFCTRNTLQRPLKMELKLVTGPFKQFDGVWLFSALPGGGSEVSFELTFSFSSMLLNITAGQWMEDLAGEQVGVICGRAKTIYG